MALQTCEYVWLNIDPTCVYMWLTVQVRQVNLICVCVCVRACVRACVRVSVCMAHLMDESGVIHCRGETGESVLLIIQMSQVSL